MRMRLLQTRNLVLIALAVAAYGTQACSSNDQDDLVVAQKTTQASSVSIHLEDASGNDIGSCAGALVQARMRCVFGSAPYVTAGTFMVCLVMRACVGMALGFGLGRRWTQR